MSIVYDSALLPPPDPTPLPADLSFSDQMLCILRTIDLLQEIYPGRIARQQATKEASDAHIAGLLACAETLGKLASGEDPRPGAAILSSGSLEWFAPRAAPRKTPEERHALAAPAAKKNGGKKHQKPFDDELPEQLQTVSNGDFGHELE